MPSFRERRGSRGKIRPPPEELCELPLAGDAALRNSSARDPPVRNFPPAGQPGRPLLPSGPAPASEFRESLAREPIGRANNGDKQARR